MADDTVNDTDIWQIKMSIEWRSPRVLGILVASIGTLLAAEIVFLLFVDLIGGIIKVFELTKRPLEGWIALIPFVGLGVWIAILSRLPGSPFKSWIVAFPLAFLFWVICVVVTPALSVWLWWTTLGEIVMPERMLPLLMVVGTGALYLWVALYNLFIIPGGPPGQPAAAKAEEPASEEVPADEGEEDRIDQSAET